MRNDGGPAYPRAGFAANDTHDRFHAAPQDGMSLRDYFAAKAMVVVLNNPYRFKKNDHSAPLTEVDIAACAYEVADAMLKAREA